MEPHGSFAFTFEENYTLISVSGAWNQECAKIYDGFLRKRVEPNPELDRCVILDGRGWGLETPGCKDRIRDLHRFISGYFNTLYIAYYITPEMLQIGKFLMDQRNKEFKNVFHWDFFMALDQAVSWLTSKGFILPDLSDEDFPKPIPAAHYLKFL